MGAPSLAAAPELPATRPRHSASAASMISRSPRASSGEWLRSYRGGTNGSPARSQNHGLQRFAQHASYGSGKANTAVWHQGLAKRGIEASVPFSLNRGRPTAKSRRCVIAGADAIGGAQRRYRTSSIVPSFATPHYQGVDRYHRPMDRPASECSDRVGWRWARIARAAPRIRDRTTNESTVCKK